jgi:hypothetical protein
MSDTSTDTIERLAFRVDCHTLFDAEGEVTAHGDDVADTLRDLLAERNRLREAVRAFLSADDHWLRGNKGGEWAVMMAAARAKARAALKEAGHE